MFEEKKSKPSASMATAPLPQQLDPSPVIPSRIQRQAMAGQQLTAHTLRPVALQRQQVRPIFQALDLQREVDQGLAVQRNALQAEAQPLRVSAGVVKSDLHRQAARHAPVAPLTQPPASPSDWVQAARLEIQRVQDPAALDQTRWLGAADRERHIRTLRSIGFGLAQGFKTDRGPAVQRYAEYGDGLATLQRQALTAGIPRMVLAQMSSAERPMLQRAVDEALQRQRDEEERGASALKVHSLQRQLADLDHQAEQPIMERLQARRGGGTPLPASVQRQLEAGLNHDLSGVRVHTDGEADLLSKKVNAVAFTTGQDIYFQSGKFDPNSQSGVELLAHEATHTVQQSKGQVGKGIDPDAGLEAEARDMGRRISRREQPVGSHVERGSTVPGHGMRAGLQRQALAKSPSRSWQQSHALGGTLTADGTVLEMKVEQLQVLSAGVVVGRFTAPNGAGRIDGFLNEAGVVYWTAHYETGSLKGQSRRFHGRIHQQTNGVPDQIVGKWLGSNQRGGEQLYHLNAAVAKAVVTDANGSGGESATTTTTAPSLSVAPTKPWSQTLKPDTRMKLPALQESGFLSAFHAMCQRLSIPPDLLLGVMTFESADSNHHTRGLDPKADNGMEYYGLIQFGRASGRDLGIDNPKTLTNMTATQQLPYVEKYLEKHGVLEAVARAKTQGRPLRLEELYMSILGGNASQADKPIWKTKTASPAGYENNSGLDSNADGAITPTEAADAVRLHWRDVYGNNLDERSRYLERIWFVDPKDKKRKWKVKEHAEIFSPLLNAPDDASQIPSPTGPAQNGKPAGNAVQMPTPAKSSGGALPPTPQAASATAGKISLPSPAQVATIRRQNIRGTPIGSLDGVEAYLNSHVPNIQPRHYSTDGKRYEYGLEWECVEFIRRYYYDTFKIEFAPRSGHAAAYFNSSAEQGGANRGLQQYKNGGNMRPQYQDIVVMGPNAFSGVGHIAIVASASANSFTVAQQNVGTSFLQEFKIEENISHGEKTYRTTQAYSAYNILGWMRR